MAGLSAIVMASGFSKRFGQKNKLLMPLGQMTIIERTVQSLIDAQVNQILVVTQYKEVAAIFSNNPSVEVVMNASAVEGISASIRLGVAASQENHGFMFVPGDQALLQSQTLKSLTSGYMASPDKIIIPIYKGTPGSPKIFPPSLRKQLMELTGDHGGRAILQHNQSLIKKQHFQQTLDNLDIDTYDRYQRIREDFQ